MAHDPDYLTIKVWDSYHAEGRYWPDSIVASPGTKFCLEGWNSKTGSWDVPERHFFVGVTWPQLYSPELGADTDSYCTERSYLGNGSSWGCITNADLGIRVKVRSVGARVGSDREGETVTAEPVPETYDGRAIGASFDLLMR